MGRGALAIGKYLDPSYYILQEHNIQHNTLLACTKLKLHSTVIHMMKQ